MNRIRLLREQNEWIQKELASSLNVKESAISKYENEKIPLTDELIRKLCDIFKVSADYLLGISESNNIPKTNTLLFQLNAQEKNMIVAFRKLDSDYKNIVIGELNKCLKYQEQENTSKKIPSATKEA